MTYVDDNSGEIITAFNSEGVRFDIGDVCVHGVISSFYSDHSVDKYTNGNHITAIITYAVFGNEKVQIDYIFHKRPNILLLLKSKR